MRRAVPVVLLAAMAGCGTGGPEPRGSGAGRVSQPPESPAPSAASSPSASASPTMSSTDFPTGLRPSDPPTKRTDTFLRIGVAGVVTEENGCRILVSDVDVRYVLRGGLVDSLRVGNAVKVVGRATGGYDDQCSGIPFRVTEVLHRSDR